MSTEAKMIEALEDYILLMASVYDFPVDDPRLPDVQAEAIKAEYVKTRLVHLADSIKIKREIQNGEADSLADD